MRTSINKILYLRITLSLIILLFFSIDTSFAWETKYHKTIAKHAIGVLPDQLKQYLSDVSIDLLSGTEEPDKNRVDNHKLPIYSLTINKVAAGGAQSALEKFAKKAEEMIKEEDDKQKIAFVLGQAVHFIQDINLPLHAVSGETKDQHSKYEKIAYYPKWPGEKYGYDGFYLVKDYKCFVYEAAKRSSKDADQALENPSPPEIIEKTWNNAVNDTANLLQSIFYRALGQEKSLELYGIPSPKGIKGEGMFCW